MTRTLPRDLLALVLLLSAAACEGRQPIGTPSDNPTAGATGTGASAGQNNGGANQNNGFAGQSNGPAAWTIVNAPGGTGGTFQAPPTGGGPSTTGCGDTGGAGGAAVSDTGGAGGLAPDDTGGLGGSAFAIPTGAGGNGVLDGAPCSSTTIANPYGGSSGQCLADYGLYANVPKDKMDRCPCSRALGRANPPEHFYCPPGVGGLAEGTIGPEGGTIMLPGFPGLGNEVDLEIPPGALPAPQLIYLIPLPIPTPNGYTDLSPIYALEPRGLKLAVSAKLRIGWDVFQAAGFPYRVQSATQLYQSSAPESCYQPVPGSSPGAGITIGLIDHFGYVFTGYPASLDPAICFAPGR
jgi:hypothetical protein